MTFLTSFAKRLKSFCAESSGQVALTAGIVAVPLLAVAGIAMDYSQYSSAKAKLQQITDAAALAVSAKYMKSGSASGLDAVAKEYIDTNIAMAGLTGIREVAPQVTVMGDYVEVRLTGSFDTTFLKLLNIDAIDFQTTQEGGSQGEAKVMAQVMLPAFNAEYRGEIALVMDYSSSMTVPPSSGGGAIKWIAMRDEVLKLFDGLSQNGQNQYIKYGVVPFANRVRVSMANNLYKGQTTAATAARCIRDRNYPHNREVTTPNTSTAAHVSKFNISSNSDCTLPAQNTVRPLTADHAATQTFVNALSTGSGTHIALGLETGWHVLSSNAPYTEGVASLTGPGFTTMKAVVLLTDGEQTSDGYGPGSSDNTSQAVSNMLDMCESMKAEGIRVITVAYDLANVGIIADLENCASTDPDTGQKWAWNPRSNSQLASAFLDIRAKLVRDLYVSR